jgi:hypothetical protein
MFDWPYFSRDKCPSIRCNRGLNTSKQLDVFIQNNVRRLRSFTTTQAEV